MSSAEDKIFEIGTCSSESSDIGTPTPSPSLIVAHSAGFFSCCTIFLEHILDYYNAHQTPPQIIDSMGMFTWYKTEETCMKDIKTDYFEYIHEETEIPSYRAPVKTTDKNIEQQYVNYQYLNYKSLTPFIRRYFSPSQLVKGMIDELVYKYDIDYDNTCVLFYRGNDKVKENHLPSYDKYLTHAKIIQRLYPDIRFLVQSDETEFLEYMDKAFPDNHVIFYDEIRHMPRNPLTTVDRLFSRDVTAELSKYYLAITYIMSKCRYVVCGTGNCSFWIALFRGGFDGITQFNYWTSAHKPEAH